MVKMLLTCLIFLMTAASIMAEEITYQDRDTVEVISSDSLEVLTEIYLSEAGYRKAETAVLSDTLLENLGYAEGSVFRGDSNISPLGKAVLITDLMEELANRLRYRVSYAFERVLVPPAAYPVTISFIQVDRFNLGTAIRSELINIYGEEHVAPLDDFKPGAHVSWRLVTLPVMGLAAHVIGASRATITEKNSASMDCFGKECNQTKEIIENLAGWSEDRRVEPEFTPTYEMVKNGLLTPVAAIELLAQKSGASNVEQSRYIWRGFEALNKNGVHVAFGYRNPAVKAIIETGLGQDHHVSAAIAVSNIHENGFSISWDRIVGFPCLNDSCIGSIIHQQR